MPTTLASTITGRPATFILAVAVILAWAITGPLFNYSDTWQLVINTRLRYVQGELLLALLAAGAAFTLHRWEPLVAPPFSIAATLGGAPARTAPCRAPC